MAEALHGEAADDGVPAQADTLSCSANCSNRLLREYEARRSGDAAAERSMPGMTGNMTQIRHIVPDEAREVY